MSKKKQLIVEVEWVHDDSSYEHSLRLKHGSRARFAAITPKVRYFLNNGFSIRMVFPTLMEHEEDTIALAKQWVEGQLSVMIS